MSQLTFVFIIVILLILINTVKLNKEFFEYNIISGNNVFYSKINNIFKNDTNYNLPYINFTNQIPIDKNNQHDVPEIKTMDKINQDAIANSKHNVQKTICDSYKNQALCWENNKCQWVFDLKNPYCKVTTTMLL